MIGVEVRDLRVTYDSSPPVQALDGVSLEIGPGRCLGLLGESGSGKSTLARALLGLLPDAGIEGSIRLGGRELTSLDEQDWRDVRWRQVALVFQSTSALNPVLRVGDQVAEPLEAHLGYKAREATGRANELLEEIGLGPWAMGRYPRELSGGQRRLVLLAMALACDPPVLVLDEPTAGLDPQTRASVLALLRSLRHEQERTLLVLTHDVESLGGLADEVAVLYRGWLAEMGPARQVLDSPRAPYSWGLLNARPTLGTVKDLRGIRGDPPDPTSIAVGCPFVERCTQAIDDCAHDRPPLLVPHGEEGQRVVACVRAGLVPVVRAGDLHKSYQLRSGALRRVRVLAVDGVDLEIREGEVVALVGANGAGKSTVAQMLALLLEPDRGWVELEGQGVAAVTGKELKALRRRVQMLFQDPYEALSPRLTVAEVVREPLDVQGIGTSPDRDRMVIDRLAEVRLPTGSGFLHRHTHELSGGQLQRVALARALVLEPKLLVADEPLEGLDPSEQAKVLQLLKGIQVERGMTMVLVSHDLAVVLRVADRVYVLDKGRVVEEATSTELLLRPRHAVTRSLLAAAGRDALFAGTAMSGDDSGIMNDRDDLSLSNEGASAWSEASSG